MKEEHLHFSSRAASLLPRAGFLAKNQTFDFTQKPIIVLPDLRQASRSLDCGPWCPVRALKYYLQKTKDLRTREDGTMEDQLFLITVSPFTPEKKSTMARWIISKWSKRAYTRKSHSWQAHMSGHTIWGLKWHLGPSTKGPLSKRLWILLVGHLLLPSSRCILRIPSVVKWPTSARVLSAAANPPPPALGSLRK